MSRGIAELEAWKKYGADRSGIEILKARLNEATKNVESYTNQIDFHRKEFELFMACRGYAENYIQELKTAILKLDPEAKFDAEKAPALQGDDASAPEPQQDGQ